MQSSYNITTMKALNKYINTKFKSEQVGPVNPVSLNKYNTFIIIKPGFTKRPNDILDRFTSKGYTVARCLARRLPLEVAKDLYKVHKDEDFYDDLCKYMSSGLSIGYVLNCPAKDPIKTTDKIKKEIRTELAKDEMRNALHSSDSMENVWRESKIYFDGK